MAYQFYINPVRVNARASYWGYPEVWAVVALGVSHWIPPLVLLGYDAGQVLLETLKRALAFSFEPHPRRYSAQHAQNLMLLTYCDEFS